MDRITKEEAKVKGLKKYFTGEVCPKNHISERWVSTRACIACTKERNLKWKCENPDKVREGKRKWNDANPEKNREYKKKSLPKDLERAKRKRKENPIPYMIYRAKERANKLSIPFNLTKDDIIIPDTCPVLNIPIILGEGMCSDNSPSLDRIIPSLGYVRGNIVVISLRANRIKNDATIEELAKILKFYQM